MKTKTIRPAAILLCFLMLFTYLCPYVYATGDDNITEFTEEWYERYGVDNDLKPYDDKVDEYWIRDALGYTGDNAMTIFYFLLYDMSLHTSAAVGILTNIYCESSFNYNAVGDNGTSYGICQWHAGRWEKLKNYCNNNGLDWQSLGGQLSYLKYETEVDYPNTMAAIRDTGNDADGAWRSA